MTEEIEKKVDAIAQNDPFSAQHPHFDFQTLRREGLKHIGDLSGKIWTDHNTHDPGITILEELCYALIDLGYRTTFPIQDLLAQPRDDSLTSTEDDSPRHENFFTPLEVLSCNPTTVLDFRKLLLDIDGIRNAWLEPDESDAPPYLCLQHDNLQNPELQCWPADKIETCPNSVTLNGLYSINIQNEVGADKAKVIKSVVEALSAHRNLCEDFSAIRMLRPFEVGICADVDIKEIADAATVYEAIIRNVKAYISPEIVYYTLKELLDKGRTIEEIFAGRPLLESRSAGFVDTEELEALPFRDVLQGSDLYAIILAVEGVVAVRNLSFQASVIIVDKTIQRVIVPSGSVAEFSLDRTCVNLQTAERVLFVDKERVHSRLQEGSKPRRGPEHLDLPIPEGRYRPGLSEYYSIQYDFPLVYGIGKGGLPNEATPLRKAQAIQLKGYLLFYDQLLANYLAQIANLRHLFSLQVESKRPDSGKHTYFIQGLESVPDVQRLFPKPLDKALPVKSILAVPVVADARITKKLEELKANPLSELRITDSCERTSDEIPHFSEASKSRLEVRIRQSIRDFHLGDFSLELSQDRNGHLFILRFKQTCELVLVSYQRYKNQDEAREAANFAAFLASQPDYYARRLQQIDPEGSQIEYQYNLVYDPQAYTDYFQFLMENEVLYLQRREAFLDHLLARFATQFTDYALLRFGAEVEAKLKSRQTVEDKSRFLSRFDDLSRDRGRAYDYLQPAWGTENVSGFEKRVSLLAGMQDFRRRHLCKYEVVERFRVEIENPNGGLWFSSIDTYPSREKLVEAKRNLIEQLKDPSSYEKLRGRTWGFNPISVGRIFSCVATDENIEVSRYAYALILKDSDDNVLRESNKQDYATHLLAWRGLSKFIKEIKNGNGMELVEAGPKSGLYINNRQMQCHIDPIITYRWQRYDFQGIPIASASAPFPSPAAAIEDFAHNADLGNFIIKKTDVVIWSLNPGEKYPPLVSIHAFNNELEAQRAWLRLKSDGQIKERYRKDPEPEGQGTRITLTTERGIELATAIIPLQDSVDIEEYIEYCQAEFGRDTEKLEFRKLPSAYGWRLAQQGKNALAGDDEIMESALLFQDTPGALFGLLDALVAVKDAKNYFTAGTEDNSDYRIFLRSSGGILIASTPSYADATERKKNLKLVRGRLMRLHPPLEIQEEPRLYRWKLCRATDEQIVLESGEARVFDSEAAAKTDFESFIHRVNKEQPDSPVGQLVYTIDLKEIEDKYRFVYCLNGPNDEVLPLLQSAEEYSADEVRGKYAEFVTALGQMQRKNGSVRVAGTDAPSADLIEDTENNRSTIDRILEYMQVQYSDTLQEDANPKWIYRLLDRDNPIAKSKESYPTKEDAKAAMNVICGYKPCRKHESCPKKNIVRVICPELDPGKYHYALFLGTKDDNGVECATLISYMGYASEDEARKAGEGNWLALIERAADPGNYGDNQIISMKMTYGESTGSECDRAGIHLAVKPEAVEKDDAVTCAKCYPIRITYKKDDDGKPTSQVKGFHFQGYDMEADISLWRSTVDYGDADQALDAYQLFLTLLGNIESCRIECDEGCYRIHLVEVLAESRDFDAETEVWGDMSEVERDDCGRDSCPAQGVRLFAQTAISETAFVPVCDGDGYSFEIVAKGYFLAGHTCDYQSRAERDKAKNAFHRWVKDGGVDFLYLPDPKIENPTRQNGFLQFNLGKGYSLRSYKALPDLQKSDDEKIVDGWLWFASSRRNYRYNQEGSWILVNPLENDLAIATIEFDNNSGIFDIDTFKELIRAYPVFKKDDGYHFRLYYPQNTGLLDEKLTICGCSKANKSKQIAGSKYCDQAYIYQSIESYSCRAAAENAFIRFLDLLIESDHYKNEEETGLGTFSFSIIDPDQVLASHPHKHPDRASALRAEERVRVCVGDEGMHLVEHILLRPQTEAHCDCLLPVRTEFDSSNHLCTLEWQEDLDPEDPCSEEKNQKLTYVPGADPYSFWATVVLPSWTERFRNNEKRHFFRQMLYREVPAMVGLNIVWLGPRQMYKFERVFKSWLSSRQLPPALCKGDDDPFYDMVKLIGGLCNESLCPDPETIAATCDCITNEEMVQDDECIEESESLFWSECEQEKKKEVTPPAAAVVEAATVRRVADDR